MAKNKKVGASALDLEFNTVELPPSIEIKESSVHSGEAGAFAKILILKDTRFGPYKGEIINAGDKGYIDYRYAWEVFEKNSNVLKYTISAMEPTTSNWMRHVNCARFYEEQNILSVQDGFSIFYIAMKDIKEGEELLTWFDPKLLKRTQRRLSKMERKPVGYTIELVPWSEEKKFVPEIIETKRARKKKVLSDMICLDEDPLAITRTLQSFPKIPCTPRQLAQSSSSRTVSQPIIERPQPVARVPTQSAKPQISASKKGRKPGIPNKSNPAYAAAKQQFEQRVKDSVAKGNFNATCETVKASGSVSPKTGLVENQVKVKRKRGRKKIIGLTKKGNVKLGRPKLQRTSEGEVIHDDANVIKPVVVKHNENGSITVEDHDETFTLKGMKLQQQCDDKCACLDKERAMRPQTQSPMKGQNTFVIFFTLLPEHKSLSSDKKIIYRCDVCDSAYNHAFSLKRHYLSVHINHRYLSRDDIRSCQIETFHAGVLVENDEPHTSIGAGVKNLPTTFVTTQNSASEEKTSSMSAVNISDLLVGDSNCSQDSSNKENNVVNEKLSSDIDKLLLCKETLADEGVGAVEDRKTPMSVPSLASLAQKCTENLNKFSSSSHKMKINDSETHGRTGEERVKNLRLECDESLTGDLLRPIKSESGDKVLPQNSRGNAAGTHERSCESLPQDKENSGPSVMPDCVKSQTGVSQPSSQSDNCLQRDERYHLAGRDTVEKAPQGDYIDGNQVKTSQSGEETSASQWSSTVNDRNLEGKNSDGTENLYSHTRKDSVEEIAKQEAMSSDNPSDSQGISKTIEKHVTAGSPETVTEFSDICMTDISKHYESRATVSKMMETTSQGDNLEKTDAVIMPDNSSSSSKTDILCHPSSGQLHESDMETVDSGVVDATSMEKSSKKDYINTLLTQSSDMETGSDAPSAQHDVETDVNKNTETVKKTSHLISSEQERTELSNSQERTELSNSQMTADVDMTSASAASESEEMDHSSKMPENNNDETCVQRDGSSCANADAVEKEASLASTEMCTDQQNAMSETSLLAKESVDSQEQKVNEGNEMSAAMMSSSGSITATSAETSASTTSSSTSPSAPVKSIAPNQPPQQVIFVTNIVFPIVSPTHKPPASTSASSSLSSPSSSSPSVPSVSLPQSSLPINIPAPNALANQGTGMPLVLISQIPHGLNVQNAASAFLQSSTALKTLQTIQSSLNVVNLGNTATRLTTSNLPLRHIPPAPVFPNATIGNRPALSPVKGVMSSQVMSSNTSQSPTSSYSPTKLASSDVSLDSTPGSSRQHKPSQCKSATGASSPSTSENGSSGKLAISNSMTSVSKVKSSEKVTEIPPDDLYRCHMCVLVFKTMSELKHHIKNDPHRFKGGIKQYACLQCSMRFSNKNNLNRHNLMNHPENENYKFRCFTCGKGFTSETYLKMHARFHSGKNFPCKYGCVDVYFPNAASLVKHLRTQHAGLDLKEYLKNAKAEKARKKKLNRIFGVSDEQIARLGLDTKPSETASVPYSMTQPGIGFQAKRGRPKGSKNLVQRLKPPFINDFGKEKFTSERIPVSKSDLEESESCSEKKPGYQVTCKLCLKSFSTHLKLLQHRSRKHGASQSVQEYLYKMSSAVQDDELSETDSVKLEFSPPPSPKTFFANVNRKGHENMREYIDGHSESLKSWRKFLSFDGYISLSEPQRPVIQPERSPQWTFFNFPPCFQYKEDCTKFYNESSGKTATCADLPMGQIKQENISAEKTDVMKENLHQDSFPVTIKTECEDTDYEEKQNDGSGVTQNDKMEVEKEGRAGMDMSSKERGISLISKLEEHLRGQGGENDFGTKENVENKASDNIEIKTEVDTDGESGSCDEQVCRDKEVCVCSAKTATENSGVKHKGSHGTRAEDSDSANVKDDVWDICESVLQNLVDKAIVNSGSRRPSDSQNKESLQRRNAETSSCSDYEMGDPSTSGSGEKNSGIQVTSNSVKPDEIGKAGKDVEKVIPLDSTDSGISSLASDGFSSLEWQDSTASGSLDSLSTAISLHSNCDSNCTYNSTVNTTGEAKNVCQNKPEIPRVGLDQHLDGSQNVSDEKTEVLGHLVPTGPSKQTLTPSHKPTDMPLDEKLQILRSPFMQGINIESSTFDSPKASAGLKYVLPTSVRSHKPISMMVKALDLHIPGGQLSEEKIYELSKNSSIRSFSSIIGSRQRTLSLPSLGIISLSKQHHKHFDRSLDTSLNTSDTSRHDHRRYSIWTGQVHQKSNKGSKVERCCCPVVEAVRKQETMQHQERYEYNKAKERKKMSKQLNKKLDFAEALGLLPREEYEQTPHAHRQTEFIIKPPEIWSNYENIWFGKKGTITVVCSICHRHFSCWDLCLRHQLKKHPHIEPASLEMERDNYVEDMYYYYPMPYGILAQTQLIPDNLPLPEVYVCTRCDFPFKNLNKLHAHIITCDPRHEEAMSGFGISQQKPSYLKKKKLLPMMDRRLHQDPVVPPPKAKVGRPFKVRADINKESEINNPKGSQSSFGRRNIIPKSLTSDYVPDASVFQSHVPHSSPFSFYTGRRRKNYELLYNPQNHTRRREMYKVLDQHQCHGCNLKFKSLSMLERHVKKCSGRDKLRSQKPLLSGIMPDDAAMRKQHTCRYCNKRFTYIKGVDLHYKRICAVRKVKEEENKLTEEDYAHEEELRRIIEHMKWSKTLNKDSSDIIQGHVRVEEDGTLTRLVKKRGWPRGLKKKVKKKGFKWTSLKRHLPSDEVSMASSASNGAQDRGLEEDENSLDQNVSEVSEDSNQTSKILDHRRLTRSTSREAVHNEEGTSSKRKGSISNSDETAPKRGRPTSQSSTSSSVSRDNSVISAPENEMIILPRTGRRGRPRKYPVDTAPKPSAKKKTNSQKSSGKDVPDKSKSQPTSNTAAKSVPDHDIGIKPPARKRGRPKKFDPDEMESSYKKKKVSAYSKNQSKSLPAAEKDDYMYDSSAMRGKSYQEKSETSTLNQEKVSGKSSQFEKKEKSELSDMDTRKMMEKMRQLKEASKAASKMGQVRKFPSPSPSSSGKILSTQESNNMADSRKKELSEKKNDHKADQAASKLASSSSELFKHLTHTEDKLASVKHAEKSASKSKEMQSTVTKSAQPSDKSVKLKGKTDSDTSSTFLPQETNSSKRKLSTESSELPPPKQIKITSHSPASKSSAASASEVIVTIKGGSPATTKTVTASSKLAKKSDSPADKPKSETKMSPAKSEDQLSSKTPVSSSAELSPSASSPTTKAALSTSETSGSCQFVTPVSSHAPVSVRVVTLSPNRTNLLTYDKSVNASSNTTTYASQSTVAPKTSVCATPHKIVTTSPQGSIQVSDKPHITIQAPYSQPQSAGAQTSTQSHMAGHIIHTAVVTVTHSTSAKSQIISSPAIVTVGIEQSTGQIFYKGPEGIIQSPTTYEPTHLRPVTKQCTVVGDHSQLIPDGSADVIVIKPQLKDGLDGKVPAGKVVADVANQSSHTTKGSGTVMVKPKKPVKHDSGHIIEKVIPRPGGKKPMVIQTLVENQKGKNRAETQTVPGSISSHVISTSCGSRKAAHGSQGPVTTHCTIDQTSYKQTVGKTVPVQASHANVISQTRHKQVIDSGASCLLNTSSESTHLQIKGGIVTQKPKSSVVHSTVGNVEQVHLISPTKLISASIPSSQTPGLSSVCVSDSVSVAGSGQGTLPAIIVPTSAVRLPMVSGSASTPMSGTSSRLTSPPTRFTSPTKLVTFSGTVIPNVIQGSAIQAGTRVLKLGTTLSAASSQLPVMTSQGVRAPMPSRIIPAIVTQRPLLLNAAQLPRVISPGARLPRPLIQTVPRHPLARSQVLAINPNQAGAAVRSPVMIHPAAATSQQILIQKPGMRNTVTISQPISISTAETTATVPMAQNPGGAVRQPGIVLSPNSIQTSQIMFSLDDGTTAMLDPDSLAQFLSISPSLNKTELETLPPKPGVVEDPEKMMVSMTEIQPGHLASDEISWPNNGSIDLTEASDSSFES